MITATINTPIGGIGIWANNSHLVRLQFLWTKVASSAIDVSFLQQIKNELLAYFEDPHFKFTVPIDLQVTPFQKRVLVYLQQLATAQTITYGELARNLQTCARAIGGACRANPLPIIIPCHRVVAQNSMGGFSGGDLANIKVKKWLLQHEAGINKDAF